ncbi:MAG: hypothetical protein QXD66_00630 [Candidatus Nezhaarchaeales archaeon]|nr:MAG: hypothetical protein DSO06_04755 [Candidatus Nezhaarchaeota archaeon WYZ-LMO8]TDA35817.1 MAG: hypothetical protein DSO05_04735 [Candidatus Nezhaarchaeota archaeon WYZ-LMO7]
MVVHLKIDEQILVDKYRDPQGNVIALTSLEVWKALKPVLSVYDLEEVHVEISGKKVLLKSKSRAKIKAIVNKAKNLGITILGSL